MKWNLFFKSFDRKEGNVLIICILKLMTCMYFLKMSALRFQSLV